jgi:Tfp pilus assembly protein PilF
LHVKNGANKTNFFRGMDRIEKIKEFLKATPADNFLQHALALEYVKIGEDEQAKNIFQTLLANDPGYVGSYYHLAKLLERNNETDAAISIYEKGMEAAKNAGDQHAFGELRGAWEELTF